MVAGREERERRRVAEQLTCPACATSKSLKHFHFIDVPLLLLLPHFATLPFDSFLVFLMRLRVHRAVGITGAVAV